METPFQPILPDEVRITDAEIAFMDDSPPGLFPENQDSNFGLVRRILTNRVMDLVLQQDTIFNERFINTSVDFIDVWEDEVGLPTNPTATLTQRRAAVTSRLIRGPFTRTRRQNIVEKYIQATFGEVVQFTTQGVPLVAEGIAMHADPGDLDTAVKLTPDGISLTAGGVPLPAMYQIREVISGFYYEVRIKDTITPDMSSLNRELERITPSGITFDVNLVAAP